MIASKIFNYTFWFLVVASTSLFGAIRQIDSLEPLSAIIATFSKESLVVFDVDRVLIEPEDAILRLQNRNLMNNLRMKHAGHLGPERMSHLISIIHLQGKSILVDPQSLALINDLKTRSIPVIALTATQVGGFGAIKSVPDWRIQELEELGISFATSFPDVGSLTFSHLRGQGASPIFKQGILFSGVYSKGAVLESFLQKVGFHPDKVLFIDDMMHNVTAVHESLDYLGVNDVFVFHYLGAEKLLNTIHPEAADLQLKTLTEKAEWLSDQRAKALLSGGG